MKFYGTNQLGKVPKTNWVTLSDNSIKKFASHKTLLKLDYLGAVADLVLALEVPEI